MNRGPSSSSTDMDGAYSNQWWNFNNSSYLRCQNPSPNSAALSSEGDSPLASPLAYPRSLQLDGPFLPYSPSLSLPHESHSLHRAFGFPPQNININMGLSNPSQTRAQTQIKQWSSGIEPQIYDASPEWPLEAIDWNEMLLFSAPGASPASSQYTDPSPSHSPPALRYLLPCPSPSPSMSSSASASGDSTASTPSPRHGTAPTKKHKTCSHCFTTSTPLWRRDPTTHQPLCNACGLYLAQRNAKRPAALIAADRDPSPSADDDASNFDANAPECTHCHTHRTSVWRRSKTGAKLCNACGVYARLRGKDRPLSLRKNRIRPRSKHPKKEC
ncbi:hypothetical protein B0H12DRAFT_1149574 [Mycena haematopus]|nr:hypothetical protein B0H12DRAFT_1149574 [Mycena haematopus]